MKIPLHKFVLFLFLPFCLKAQQLNSGNYIGVGIQIGNREIPYFQRINQFGVVPPTEGNHVYLDAAVYSPSDSNSLKKEKKWTWGYGVEGRVLQGNTSYFFLPVAHVQVRRKQWEIYVGRRKDLIGLIDSTQTIGAYSWSGNALPMPKIQISTADWVHFANGWLGFKIGLSHGWFGNQESTVVGHWLHQKWLYGRVGSPSQKWQLSAGLNHQVQWGGETKIDNPFISIDGKLAPYPWYSYRFVIIPFLQKLVPLDQSKLPPYDTGLAIGNQLGSVDISAEYQIGTHQRIHLYKQHPYDFARSLYTLNNLEDGLYGVSYSNKKSKFVNKLIFEFFNSKSQGRTRAGKINESNFGEIDNYFSHGQYGSWSYRNTLLGTPFITFLNDENGSTYMNNRTTAFHLSTGGIILGYTWLTRFALINYWGNWSYERKLNQQSLQFKIESPLYQHKIQWVASLGSDLSSAISENYLGVAFSIRKKW